MLGRESPRTPAVLLVAQTLTVVRFLRVQRNALVLREGIASGGPAGIRTPNQGIMSPLL